MHLEEVAYADITPSPFSNAIAAFNNSQWRYGKLYCKSLSTFGAADIYFRLGYDALRNELHHLAFYGCVFIPTSRGLTSHYLFEPTLGALGHAGVGLGLNADGCIWQRGQESFVNIMTDFRYVYFFSRHETRTTDLFTNEDWSRYLLTACFSNLELPLPGINAFTQSVQVNPRSTVNLWTALHIEHRKSHTELGYNFWWRAQEQIRGYSIANLVIYDIDGTPGERTSASNATIAAAEPGTGAPDSDLTVTPITNDMFSLETPAIPKIIINTVYASYGRAYEYHTHPLFITAGLYYDVSHQRGGFSGVGGWFKTSVAF